MTVPGTGTRFTKAFLERLGYEFNDATAFRSGPNNSGLFAHARAPQFDEVYDLFVDGSAVVVSTLRDPYLAQLSGIDQPLLRHGVHLMKGFAMSRKDDACIAQWDAMQSAYERLDADGLSIAHMNVQTSDVLDRMDMLTAICDHCDVPPDGEMISELAQTWVPVGQSRPNAKRDEYIASGTIEGVTPTHLDFAVAYYHSLV